MMEIKGGEIGALPASGPGHSAEPEPISVVSAVPASVPNAWPLMGYAPGGYTGTCHVCRETKYDLDKRARQCLECAAREANLVINKLAVRELELVNDNDRLRSLLIYLASDTHEVKPDAVRTLAKNALASGIETEGHDRADGHGAKHESPIGEAGDAQKASQ